MRRTRQSNAARSLTHFGTPLVIASVWLLAACGEESMPAQEYSARTFDAQRGPPPLPPQVDRCEQNADPSRCRADSACEWIPGPVRCPACLGPGCECSPPPPGSGECRTKEKPEPCFNRDEKVCEADTSCEWIPGPVRCPACLGPGCECSPPPPGSGECRTTEKREACFNRDEKACQADTACEWIPGPLRCPACLGPGCECSPPPPNSGECHPAEKFEPCFVGGCSGEICGERPGMVSPCIFPPPGGLPPKGAVCERRADHSCGWIRSTN
jgi:hypothetical protein